MRKPEYTVHSLGKEDIPLILDLQEKVRSAMAHPSDLRLNNNETLMFCFERTHFIPGIFDGEKLAAVCIFVDAAGTEEDLSVHLRHHTVTKPINYKLVLVHPDYRGHGWQRFLFQICAGLAEKCGYEQIVATVAPDNSYSYRNMIRAGLNEDHRENKYGGLLRSVMFLDIRDRKDSEKPERKTVYEDTCGSSDISLCFDRVKVCTEEGDGIIRGAEAVFTERRMSLPELELIPFCLYFPAAE